jgi:DNA-binding CsgD family transcriptional regulator
MGELRVLLVASRPGVGPLLGLGGPDRDGPAGWEVRRIPAAAAGLAAREADIQRASVALVDVCPDPAEAVRVCHALRRQRAGLPLVAFLCCPRAVFPLELQAIRAAGARSVLDSLAGPLDVARALRAAARRRPVISADGAAPPGGAAAAAPRRGRSPRPGPGDHAPLAPADVELLALLAQGLTDRELGGLLGVSEHTVDHRLQRLRERAGLPTRAALVAWAVEQGVRRVARAAVPRARAAAR